MLKASLVLNKGLRVDRFAVLEQHSPIHAFFARANTKYGCAPYLPQTMVAHCISWMNSKRQPSFWNV